MRRFILAAGSAALFLTAWAGPALAAVAPIGVAAPQRDDRTDAEAPAGRVWEVMMDRFTVPLGPAEQDTWLLGVRSGRWV